MRAENKQKPPDEKIFRTRMAGRTNFARSDFGSDAAGAHDAPARHRLKNGEQTRHDENQSNPPFHVTGNDDAGDEAQRANDAAGHAAVAIEVGFEEPAHGNKLAHRVPKTTGSLAENTPRPVRGLFAKVAANIPSNHLLANCIKLRHIVQP
jgi:hypothetical protein